MEYKELQKFIEALVKTGAPEIKIETEEMRIIVRNELKASQLPTVVSTTTPAVQPVQSAPQPPEAPHKEDVAAEKKSNYIEIKSPMVGTFYRKPTPDKPAYVNIGDDISEGSVLCIIEAMKLFNEIESEVNGKIVKVLVEDATPVEYDQPLFLVEPL